MRSLDNSRALPGISGIEVMKILRADPSTAHIPIVALSAHALPRDIEDGIKAGFFKYLTKPLKVTQFMDTLDAALEISSMVPAFRSAPSMRSEPSTENEVSVKANVGLIDVKRSGRN